MRILVLGAGALMLAACNNNQATTEAPAEVEAVSENFTGNDITAIDAATDDSANMAADVEVLANESNLATEALGNTNSDEDAE